MLSFWFGFSGVTLEASVIWCPVQILCSGCHPDLLMPKPHSADSFFSIPAGTSPSSLQLAQ